MHGLGSLGHIDFRQGLGPNGFIQLPTRNIVEWAPRDIRHALEACSTGNLSRIADLAKDIGRDDRVRGVLSTRTLGMLGLPFSWEGAEPEDWYALAPEAELNKLLAWGLLLGVGIAYVHPNGQLTAWHPHWTRYDWTADQWYVQIGSGEERPITPGDGSWILYMPYGEIEPWNEGLWTALAIPWLIKRYALHDRARASEVFGSAMIVGSASEGSTEDQRRKWLGELEALSRSSRLVLPDGYSLDLLEAQGQTSRIYDSAQKWADEAITICIAGQIVTTEGQSGFSRGDVHAAIAASLLSFGAETFSTCLHEQYIRPVWQLDSYPIWDTESPDRALQRAQTVQAFGTAVTTANAGLASYGQRVDAPLMAERAGIPLRALPADRSAGAIKISFAPTDIVKFVTVDEARASQGLAPLGDSRGQQFVYELQGPETPPGAPPATPQSLIAASRRDRFVGAWRMRSGIDVSEAPIEFRVFTLGRNESDHGPFKVTPRSIELLIADTRDVMIDLEHLSLEVESRNYNPDAMGWGRLEARDDGLYCVAVSWTAEGKERIESRKQRFISPAFYTNSKKEVIKLINMALTALPAMHSVEPLIAASMTRENIRGRLMLAARRHFEARVKNT